MRYQGYRRLATRDEIVRDFTRVARLTHAFIAAAHAIDKEFPDREKEGVPVEIFQAKMQELSGIELTTDYVLRAIALYQQTGIFIEDSQLDESPEEH